MEVIFRLTTRKTRLRPNVPVARNATTPRESQIFRKIAHLLPRRPLSPVEETILINSLLSKVEFL